MERIVISKKYKFIKRLVENDKIDLLRLDNRIALSEFNKVERVLMALSIQDNPIEFLISILKDKKVRTVYVDEDGNVSGDTKRYSDC